MQLATIAAHAQAMAQSVRGLRQSAVLCGHDELPLTMDLLQGSEAVAAVLCRCVRRARVLCRGRIGVGACVWVKTRKLASFIGPRREECF